MAERLLTIVFTDVEGSTALHSAKGDAEAHRLLQACDELVRQQVQAHDGRALKSLGDGLMVTFESPRRAVACALAVQGALSERAQWQATVGLRIRVGIHTGEVTEEAGDLSGAAVNAAARIAARAKGGEVLVSEVVRQLCGAVSNVAFEDHGRVGLKGFPERWRLYLATSTVGAAAVPRGQRTPFVDRAPECAELRSLLDSALAGQGGLVMVGAEPGVGKSRLCMEVAEEARRLGARVLTGHCYQREGDLPYMPWVELMETAISETTPAALLEGLGDSAPEMARIVPRLRRLLPEIPSPIELPPDQQRRFTFSSLTDYVTRLARMQPRLYILEDLHWADDSTLLLLTHLAERLATIPVLVLGTYRDPPADVSPLLADTLATLVRQRQVRLIGLRRHSLAEVEAFLRALSGQPPPAAVTAAIYGETEGNAFFVEEVFRHLAETGRLLDERGRFREDLRLAELDVPANVRLVTGQRLERLSEITQRTLAIAAVAGRRVAFDLLERIADVRGDDLIDALNEAERAGVIVTEADGDAERYWFAHELIRQTLLTRLPAARRRRHHLRVADALERLHADQLELRAADVAHHLIEAGPAAERDRTARFLILAGDQALTAAAFEEAVRSFQGALGQLGERLRHERAAVLERLGRALHGLGHFDEALRSWSDAAAAYSELNEPQAVGAVCADMALTLAWSGRLEEAIEVAGRGLAAVGDAVGRARSDLLSVSGLAHSISCNFEMADNLTRRAVADAEILDDPRALATALYVREVHHWGWGQPDDTVAVGMRAVDAMRHGGGSVDRADTLARVQFGLLWMGRLAEAEAAGAEALSLAHMLGSRGALLTTRWASWAVESSRADLATLDRLAREDLRFAEENRFPWAAYAHIYVGLAAFWRGDWVMAADSFEECARLEIPSMAVGGAWGFRILLHVYQGDPQRALAMYVQGKETLPRLGAPRTFGRLAMLLTVSEALALAGERKEASALHPMVLEAMRAGNVLRVFDSRLLNSVAGLTAAAGGQWEPAEEHLRRACRQADDMPHRIERAESRRLYAWMLVERDGDGDRALAATLLHEALDGYRAIGMPRHEAMAEALLASV